LAPATSDYYNQIIIADTNSTNSSSTNQGTYPPDTSYSDSVTCTTTST
jgi:hypothetical protein